MKKKYLDLMGIIQWRLREQSFSAPQYFSYQLNNAVGKSVGVLLADAVNDSSVSLSMQENLAQKIVEALTPNFVTPTVPQENERYVFFILLGNHVKKIIEHCDKKADHIIFHDSLTHLIQHVERKKELWSQIKPLRDLFVL